jgi:hypothetical protein
MWQVNPVRCVGAPGLAGTLHGERDHLSDFPHDREDAPDPVIGEGDTFLPENEELRGILNSGHRCSGSVIRTVGDDHEPRQFGTYAACAIAMIGKLPGTLADRSIMMELQRRLAGEPIEPFRLDRTEHLDLLASKAARWAADNADRVRAADPVTPSCVFNRVADNWRPLLAIAELVGRRK